MSLRFEKDDGGDVDDPSEMERAIKLDNLRQGLKRRKLSLQYKIRVYLMVLAGIITVLVIASTLTLAILSFIEPAGAVNILLVIISYWLGIVSGGVVAYKASARLK